MNVNPDVQVEETVKSSLSTPHWGNECDTDDSTNPKPAQDTELAPNSFGSQLFNSFGTQLLCPSKECRDDYGDHWFDTEHDYEATNNALCEMCACDLNEEIEHALCKFCDARACFKCLNALQTSEAFNQRREKYGWDDPIERNKS